jgi:hypothetical protein
MTRFSLWALALLCLVVLAPAVDAQKPPAAPPASHEMHGAPGAPQGGHMAGMAKAAPADVASADAIIAAYYEALSGPAGKKRDWNRFLSLFFPQARLLPAEGKGHAGVMPHIFTPQKYLYDTEPRMLEDGYVVKQIAKKSEEFGKITHVWSTYEGRHAEADVKPFVRGINSFQLFNDGKRWWITNVLWQPETGKVALPDEYLH